MTRKEEITNFANSQVDCEFFDESFHNGIILGAKWADKTLMEKAVKWLRDNLYDGADSDGLMGVQCRYVNVDYLIDNFHDAMEGLTD